ncbi:hypothetical protein D3C72_752570 [compost metagenome]|jgi:environmental stress-induced protein Ves
MTLRNIRLYQAADYPRMPWKNGGGTTQEVARNPEGSSAAFEWRLSIADVAQDGGFSAFNGYQRIITVLEGRGIQLTVDGREQTPLTPRQAYAFLGDARVDCRLLDGAIRDFNLIYAPQRYQARLQWASGPWIFHSTAPTVLVLNAGGELVVRVDGKKHALPSRYDCLHADGPVGLVEYRLEGEVDACVIELTPR